MAFDLRPMEDVLSWPSNANMTFDLRPTEDVLPWLGNANMAFDLRPTKDVLPWSGNANMAFDLRPTEDKLPWPGNANMAFDLQPTEDVLPWLGNANMAFDLVPHLQCLLPNGLWEMIEPKLTTEADTKKDKTAIAYIYQSLPEDQLLLISKYKTAKAVWDALKTRHVGVNHEAIGRLKTFEERLKSIKEIRVDSQESLMFTRHEGQGKPFREHGRGSFNQSRGQENNFKKESNSNSNKFTHDKSKVLCFKCKEYGHFANKCPSKKEEQSNLIEEDLEPILLMATIEEAPGSFINQKESRSKNGRKFHSD
ncbi:zinc finger, CCHC-type containing protein [Tanacetum coccineum]